MTSSEAAAWVQGVGTLLAFAVTALALAYEWAWNRRTRADAVQKEMLQAASGVTGWLIARRQQSGGLGSMSYSFATAEVRNYADQPARNVRAWIADASGERLSPSVRTVDVITPLQDRWPLEWSVESEHPAGGLGGAYVELYIEFTLNNQRFLYNGNVVTFAPKTVWPQAWERYLSYAWQALLEPDSQSVDRGGIPHAVDAAGSAFLARTDIEVRISDRHLVRAYVESVTKASLAGNDQIAKRDLGRLEATIDRYPPSPAVVLPAEEWPVKRRTWQFKRRS